MKVKDQNERLLSISCEEDKRCQMKPDFIHQHSFTSTMLISLNSGIEKSVFLSKQIDWLLQHFAQAKTYKLNKNEEVNAQYNRVRNVGLSKYSAEFSNEYV